MRAALALQRACQASAWTACSDNFLRQVRSRGPFGHLGHRLLCRMIVLDWVPGNSLGVVPHDNTLTILVKGTGVEI